MLYLAKNINSNSESMHDRTDHSKPRKQRVSFICIHSFRIQPQWGKVRKQHYKFMFASCNTMTVYLDAICLFSRTLHVVLATGRVTFYLISYPTVVQLYFLEFTPIRCKPKQNTRHVLARTTNTIRGSRDSTTILIALL